MTEELLPCPFCGGTTRTMRWHGGGPDRRFIGCNAMYVGDCPATPSVIGETLQEAIKEWNTRALPKLQKVLIDSMAFVAPSETVTPEFSRGYNAAIDDIKTRYGELYAMERDEK